MKEINLIVSQEKLEQNRKNALLKDATNKNYEQQKDLARTCMFAIIGLALILVMAWVLHITNDLKQKGIQGCMENGYSYSYCIEHS